MALSKRGEARLKMFRRRLVHHRKIANMNQTQFAKEVGVAAATVSQWEGGQRTPLLAQLLAIADALNVTVVELFLPLRETDG